MRGRRRKLAVQIASGLALLALLSAAAAAETALSSATLARLTDVTVAQQPGATIIHVKTAGAAKYRAGFFATPDRLVLDFEDTRYGWRTSPLLVAGEPLQQIRGSQYRKDVTRVVMHFSRPVGYAIREDPDGLVVVIPTAEIAPMLAKPATSEPANVGSPVVASVPADTAPGKAQPAPTRIKPPIKASAAPSPRQGRLAAPIQVAQAQAPTPAPAPGRLISLDFKDADVVNLLRILAIESGRNVVIGDDVKGKMSISLRNVAWELALETILESRSLEKLEKDGVLRIVTREQLTREREARARVEEARLKGEAEVRAKIAEAELKEAEAIQRKLAAEAAQREQEARGPLREETIRLSYADPEEVAKTLQGILGIPPEGQKIQGPGIVTGPIAEPPFSQLFGPQPSAPSGAAPVSVSQDVLAKGLTIRAHKPTNTLFLRLYAADLERVKKIITESLDIPLPQVKIEARMEILDRSALEQIGVQWGGMTAQPLGRTTLVGQGLQTTTVAGQTVPFLPGFTRGTTSVHDPTPVIGFETGTQPNTGINLRSSADDIAKLGGLPVSFQTGLPLGGNLINLPISALPNAGPLPAGGINFGIIGTRFNVNLALQALATQGKTRTLARPEIVTVENNKATVSLGEEIPFATISSAGTQISFKEALLKLEVTPTVIREGETTLIKLIVVVENNSRGDVVNLGNAGQPPAISKRRAETQVLIKEGDRLVIGGVTQASNQNTLRKVPIFGDIPLLGHLFKHRESFDTGRELVVFVTPSVLAPMVRQPERPGAVGPAAPAVAPPAVAPPAVAPPAVAPPALPPR